MLKHCGVSLQSGPSTAAFCVSLPHWTWAGPGIHFNQQKVAEVTAYLFWAEALGRPGNHALVHFAALSKCVLIGGLLEVFCGELTRRKDLVLRGGERPTWAQPPSQTWVQPSGWSSPTAVWLHQPDAPQETSETDILLGSAHPQDWDNKMAFAFSR